MKTRRFLKIIMQIYEFSSKYTWKNNQSQRTSMKVYEKYSNVTQHGSKSMNIIKKLEQPWCVFENTMIF